MTSSPLFESSHSLLDEDDLVGDGLVPLYLQLHVVVVLGGRQSSSNVKRGGRSADAVGGNSATAQFSRCSGEEKETKF